MIWLFVYLYLAVHVYYTVKWLKCCKAKEQLRDFFGKQWECVDAGCWDLVWKNNKLVAPILFKWFFIPHYLYLRSEVFNVWTQNLRDNPRDIKNYIFNNRGTVSLKSNYRKDLLKWQIGISRNKFNLGFTLEPSLHHASLSFNVKFWGAFAYITIPFIRINMSPNRNIQCEFMLEDWTLWLGWTKGGDCNFERGKGFFKIVNLLDILFGKIIYFTKEVSMYDWKDVSFKFREKVYVASTIKVEQCFRFRSRVPYSLYKNTYHRLDIQVPNPPQYAGKGENSWDCGDDGTYGLSSVFPKEVFDSCKGYNERDVIRDYIIKKYCESVCESINKRGRAGGDEVPRTVGMESLEIIGTVRPEGNVAYETNMAGCETGTVNG